jgi:hypothetical protein
LVLRDVSFWELVLRRLCLLVACAASVRAADDTDRLAESLTSAAKAFLAAAPRFSAEEVMRYRKAAGGDKWDTGQAVSEYRFEIGPQGVHESRKILRSSRDKDLKPTINDAGQLLLLFESSTIGRYAFVKDRTAYDGPQAAVVYRYAQVEGPETVTIQERQKKFRQQTHGEVWVDASTYRLLRVTLDAERRGDIRDHAEVDYAYGPDGAPMPVSALHREFHSDVVAGETLFTYKPLPNREP